MDKYNDIPPDDEFQVALADPNDPDDDGGFVYGEGENEEWHKKGCPCELCRVEMLEWLERIEAGRPVCDGADCQGCPDCPVVRLGRPAVEIDKKGLYPGFSQYVMTVAQTGQALPAMLKRSDGETILYAAKINSVFGEPGMAKSWIALKTAIEALENGGRVLWWDFEDKPDTMYRRAKAMGKLDLITGENVAFIKDNNILELDEDSLPNFALVCAVEWLAEGGIYSVVIIDAAESSGAPSDGSPVTEWNREKIQPFASRSVGALILDHVPKRRQERPRGAIGSQHKLAKIDGAAIAITGKAWTKTQDGALVLRLEKDRQGDVPGNVGAKIAVVKGHYEGELLTISIDPPNQDDDGEVDVSMLLLDAIGGAGAEGVRGQNALMRMVKGKGQAKAQALIDLIGDGLVVQTKDGKAQVHTITDAGLIVLGEGYE